MENSYYVKDDEDDYDFGYRLVGPNNFQCLLSEPEDRNWYRDGAVVVDELNKLDAEIARLRRALDLLGVQAQAKKDPDKAPPLRIDVRMAREVMEVING